LVLKRISLDRAIRKLGEDLRTARIRRRIPVTVLAERASVSRSTLQKMERGNAGVALGHYAAVLFSLGMINRLADLADSGADVLGRELEEEQLPQRIRMRKTKGA
jgi:transcriptional regulator with XRE-family HTH domain